MAQWHIQISGQSASLWGTVHSRGHGVTKHGMTTLAFALITVAHTAPFYAKLQHSVAIVIMNDVTRTQFGVLQVCTVDVHYLGHLIEF